MPNFVLSAENDHIGSAILVDGRLLARPGHVIAGHGLHMRATEIWSVEIILLLIKSRWPTDNSPSTWVTAILPSVRLYASARVTVLF